MTYREGSIRVDRQLKLNPVGELCPSKGDFAIIEGYYSRERLEPNLSLLFRGHLPSSTRNKLEM